MQSLFRKIILRIVRRITLIFFGLIALVMMAATIWFALKG